MRLRYLRIRGKPPLEDTAVIFGREEIIGLNGAIHFVVGVNGTGKSRMLQVLAEVLLILERRQVPSFPVTLAYDLDYSDSPERTRTICFHRPLRAGMPAQLIEFKGVVREDVDWDLIEDTRGKIQSGRFRASVQKEWEVVHGTGDQPNSSLPQMELYLPEVLLTYTSGAIGSWEPIFASPLPVEATILTGLLQEATRQQERPFGYRTAEANKGSSEIRATIAMWVRGEDYRAALLAAMLHQAANEFDKELRTPEAERVFLERREHARYQHQPLPERYDENLRSVLDEVGWLWPLTVSIRTTARPDDPDWQRMAQAATAVVREPAPPDGSPQSRLLFFDLRERVGETNTARRLLRALNGIELDDSSTEEGNEAKALPALRQILTWQRRGILRTGDINIVLRKIGVKVPVSLSALSDGERMFLGRMALLYLLWDSQNALALLDEPETHFNDYWKREIVDILDKSLVRRDKSLNRGASDIVLTTHSSIALTDAFDKEITLLKRSRQDPDKVIAASPLPPTFGASPTEVLQDIFYGPRSVGQRAAEFLDTILVLLSFPQEVEEYWTANKGRKRPTTLPDVVQRAMYERFLVRETTNQTEDERHDAERQLDERLRNTLDVLGNYGRKRRYKESAMLRPIMDDLMSKVGAGYYRFEFGRRLANWIEQTNNQGN